MKYNTPNSKPIIIDTVFRLFSRMLRNTLLLCPSTLVPNMSLVISSAITVSTSFLFFLRIINQYTIAIIISITKRIKIIFSIQFFTGYSITPRYNNKLTVTIKTPANIPAPMTNRICHFANEVLKLFMVNYKNNSRVVKGLICQLPQKS